jgi:hypothetical protein
MCRALRRIGSGSDRTFQALVTDSLVPCSPRIIRVNLQPFSRPSRIRVNPHRALHIEYRTVFRHSRAAGMTAVYVQSPPHSSVRGLRAFA